MRKIILAGCLLLLVGLVMSCGTRTETTYSALSPNWTKDALVIYAGVTDVANKDILGAQMNSTHSDYVKTIYPSGTGESAALFDVTDNPAYALTCSPVGDYVAYGNDLRSALYHTLVIKNIAAGAHTGVEKTELAFNPGVKSFDWSDDGTKLVYCTTGEIRTIKIDGTGDTLVLAVNNLQCVSWHYGSRIVFVTTLGSNKLLSLVYADGSGRHDLAAGASVDRPQVSKVNTNEVFGIKGTALAKVNVGTSALTTVKASFTGAFPRLSPDATKVAYSKTGETSGIYLLDVAAGTETKIKQ